MQGYRHGQVGCYVSMGMANSCTSPVRVGLGFPSTKDECKFYFFQAEDGIRDYKVTGVQTCALPISGGAAAIGPPARGHAALDPGLRGLADPAGNAAARARAQGGQPLAGPAAALAARSAPAAAPAGQPPLLAGAAAIAGRPLSAGGRLGGGAAGRCGEIGRAAWRG